MKNKLVLNLFSSGLQAIAVQVLGVAFFYLISVYFSKDNFGIIGWANAVCMLIVTLLSCGMEQVVVRRIASSASSDWAASAFLIHTIATSLTLLLIIYGCYLLVNDTKYDFSILLLFFVAQAATYIGTPLKQLLNAKEKFAPYGVIAIISNIFKVVLIYMLIKAQQVTIPAVAYILIGTSLLELVCLLVYIYLISDVRLKITFKLNAYKKLLKESMPQYLSIIFDSSLSRIDWILLGILSTNSITADYTFAYRAYEITRLPLSILGPVILVKYSRLLSGKKMDEQKEYETKRFYVIEIFIAVLILLSVNIMWSPVIGSITDGKYGTSNAVLFFIISLCLPLHFFINLLWTLSFSAKKYKSITRITMIVAVFNLAANLILIPIYGGTGAAISYFSATLLQAIIYFRLVKTHIIPFSLTPLVLLAFAGAAGFGISYLITSNVVLQLLIAVTVYIGLAMLTRQLKKSDVDIFKAYLKK